MLTRNKNSSTTARAVPGPTFGDSRVSHMAGHSLMADDRDPAAHWAMGRAFWLRGRQDQSIELHLDGARRNGLFRRSFAYQMGQGRFALNRGHCHWQYEHLCRQERFRHAGWGPPAVDLWQVSRRQLRAASRNSRRHRTDGSISRRCYRTLAGFFAVKPRHLRMMPKGLLLATQF
jgi:hypothetical protein